MMFSGRYLSPSSLRSLMFSFARACCFIPASRLIRTSFAIMLATMLSTRMSSSSDADWPKGRSTAMVPITSRPNAIGTQMKLISSLGSCLRSNLFRNSGSWETLGTIMPRPVCMTRPVTPSPIRYRILRRCVGVNAGATSTANSSPSGESRVMAPLRRFSSPSSISSTRERSCC